MPANPAPSSGHALGVDFGTSHTVAVVRWPDGRARPLLVDGSPLLPSAVYAEPSGGLAVGRDAVHSARLDPSRYEPNPKRRVDEGTVLLGDREVAVVDLMAAVLGRVAEEWRRTVGQIVPRLTLTCPATWGATRRGMLADAAGRAGLGSPLLVAEPVAAATYFAEVLGRDVPIGSVVVVHDFGAGTFDASVVARKATGFEVLAVDGCDDVGGLDIDAALLTHLRTTYGDRGPDAWERLTNPSTVEERRAKRQLWDDIRVAKERLSRRPAADLMIPLLDLEVHLTRDELETLAKPLLEQTIRVTSGVMRRANLADGSVAGVFLVGGSSRIPLLGTMLHRSLGTAPVVIEQPELVVAEGSVLAGTALLASGAAAGAPPMGAPPMGGPPVGGPFQPYPGPPGPGTPVSGAPVSGAPISGAPVSGAPVSGAPISGAPFPGPPVSGLPGSGPRATPSTTGPSNAGPSTTGPPAPTVGAPRTVGRVIVPGAVPPGRPSGQQGASPPRVEPGATRIDPIVNRTEPVATRVEAGPNRPTTSPNRVQPAPTRIEPAVNRIDPTPPRTGPAARVVPAQPVSPPPVTTPRRYQPPPTPRQPQPQTQPPPPRLAHPPSAQPQFAYPADRARPRRSGLVRRTGRLVWRTLRFFFILVLLIGTPLLAAVIGFDVARGATFTEALRDLLWQVGISWNR